MDFFKVATKDTRGGVEVYPEFIVKKSKDLMVRGRSFYAVWDEEAGLWSRDDYRVAQLVDAELDAVASQKEGATVKYMSNFSNGSWKRFKEFCTQLGDSYHPLDQELVWANSDMKQSMYASKRLPYALEPGDFSAWDELVGRLYSVEERAKIEWAIGALVSGDAKRIQKFLVLYGGAGTGKSTILNIIQQLFEGYYAVFEAKALGDATKDFSASAFNNLPLVAIQHDGDLSRITDNTRLNSIVAHEEMLINEKYKAPYSARINAFLFMGTNQSVKITDKNSGLIRRLIDVEPTGARFTPNHYNTLLSRIDFELGAIAWHCREVYWEMGKNYYEKYTPTNMLYKTNVFYNYVEDHFDVFNGGDGVSLKQAYSLYKEWCAMANIPRVMPLYLFRDELKGYFEEFHERTTIDDVRVRNYYTGFKKLGTFKAVESEEGIYSLVLDQTESLFDEDYAPYPAQYATDAGIPSMKWERVQTQLKDIDTKKLHYVQIPPNHIIIDFDLKGPRGGKDLEENLKAASTWPPTYAELSQGGAGVHLHYIYTGDVSELSGQYADGIEVKVYTGNAALRRRLTKCNNIPIASISSGLPLKEKKMLPQKTIKTETGLRELVERNLRKEIHAGTKPSIDFIKVILDEAYDLGVPYDLTDMRSRIIAFANNSTNNADYCLKTVLKMKFQSELKAEEETPRFADDRVVLFDVEVYPNLFVVCWKWEGDDQNIVRMINPSADEIEKLLEYKLVGFNNRRYDNHILYARYMGYNNEALHKLSQKIIGNNRDALFGAAYGLSYADIYDFSSIKQSLKKFGIDLGMHHLELDIPWDEPVPEELWDTVVEYCCNDVLITEAAWNDRAQDFAARKILAELSGLPVNNTTQSHTARIIFEGDKNAKAAFVYTDLSRDFPGYRFDAGVSTYRDEVVGEGGYVYAEPGIHTNVALLDVASMHPTSIEELNLFGEYTKNFSALKKARLAIKHKDYEAAGKMLGGKLKPFLNDPSAADALSYALKIVINIVYGMTSARFENPFNDMRNIDNIVAKRGALFMIDLKHAVQEMGYQVAHIKTDSIKIPNATDEIIEFVMNFGKKYGYDFEHEATYDKMALVNDAVYIAKKRSEKDPRSWTWVAVGAEFQHPYVYKKLFTEEPIEFKDLLETRSVTKGSIWLDYDNEVDGRIFIGRIGQFVACKTGGRLLRVVDDKEYAVTGTKNWRWEEATNFDTGEFEADHEYYDGLVADAYKTLHQFGDVEEFIKT
jgi:hypothetical protein